CRSFCFFFQAEDGIRDFHVTGVQTVLFRSIDHHLGEEQLPGANAVVNPNRADDVSGLGYLCAAGVGFMALVATSRVLRMRGVKRSEERRVGRGGRDRQGVARWRDDGAWWEG